MEKAKLKELEECIKNSSAFDLASTLEKIEMYEKEGTRIVLNKIYKEFETNENLKDEIVIPVFLSIADGLLELNATTRNLRKKGLTATRIVKECCSFSYNQKETRVYIPDAYMEDKNAREQTEESFQQFGKDSRKSYNRGIYEDKSRLGQYKKEKFGNNNGKINAIDEYSGKNNVYQYQSNPDARRNIEKYKHDHQAEVDHIVPLKQIYEELKGNYALSDEDIKNIANDNYNYSLTSAMINRGAGHPGAGGKFEMTNTEFVEDQRRRIRDGLPHLGLSDEAMKNMLKMESEAKKNIDKNVEQTILDNINPLGTGTNTYEIWKTSANNAAKQTKDYVVGNLILFVIKPIFFEISDIFQNGIEGGVNAESFLQALKIRFARVKNYVVANVIPLLKSNLWGVLEYYLSSLLESIISLIVGIFKQIYKVVKEGIKAFTQACKVIFGEHSKEMTSAQKGDAITKILGGSVITICGIGIEEMVNRIGIGEPWSVVISTMLTGIASCLFMFLLDRIDLFNLNAERRQKRIEDIFDERIKDIKDRREIIRSVTAETIMENKRQFHDIEDCIWNAIKNNDSKSINDALFRLAEFMKVDLGYKNREEFIKEFDNTKTFFL